MPYPRMRVFRFLKSSHHAIGSALPVMDSVFTFPKEDSLSEPESPPMRKYWSC